MLGPTSLTHKRDLLNLLRDLVRTFFLFRKVCKSTPRFLFQLLHPYSNCLELIEVDITLQLQTVIIWSSLELCNP